MKNRYTSLPSLSVAVITALMQNVPYSASLRTNPNTVFAAVINAGVNACNEHRLVIVPVPVTMEEGVHV